MMTIKISRFEKKQIINGKDWTQLISNTQIMLESLLLTTHYQENGWSSRYIVDGFDVSFESIDYQKNKTVMIFNPGIAVIEDKIVTFPQNSSFELVLDRLPRDGDILCLSHQIVETSDNQAEKRTVNDLTPMNSETPIKIESEKAITPTLKEYLAKIEIINQEENYIDEKIYLKMKYWKENESYTVKDGEGITAIARIFSIDEQSIIDYNKLEYPYTINEGDVLLIPVRTFISFRVDKGTTLDGHRNAFFHADKSIKKIHLAKSIIGGHSKKDLTLDTCSTEIKELSGNFPISNAGSRFNKIIGQSGGFLASTPAGYGIDDIFLEKIREFLLKGKSGESGPSLPGKEWVSYQYDSSIKPCLGFETTEGGTTVFRWNPDALMSSIHAMQFASKTGVITANQNLDNMRFDLILNGFNSIPRGIQYNDLDITEIFAINSLNTVKFDIRGNYNWIMIASVNKNIEQIGNNHINAYSLVWVYDTFEDTLLIPPYPTDRYFDEIDSFGDNGAAGNFQQDWYPDGKPNTSPIANLEIGSTNCFIIGKRIYYKRD